MNETIRELIAIGASVGSHCQPCLVFHVDRARKIGVSETDIRTAVEIGHMVETGSMDAMRVFSTKTVERIDQQTDCSCKKSGASDSNCCG